MTDQPTKDELVEALDAFARVWRINAPLSPRLDAGMRVYVAGVWPTMADCKRAAELVYRARGMADA